jgi:dUTP pyrophosphatase
LEELEVTVSLSNGARLPEYATPGSSGLDLIARLEDPIELKPMERTLVPTGLFVSIPVGHEAQIRPRSGLAHKFGLTVLNSPGTIDADYRGEIKVLLINFGSDPYTLRDGDRIAQMVFTAVSRARWKGVASLAETERGEGGFGSTGR